MIEEEAWPSAGLHVMGEVSDRIPLHFQVDRHRRAAQFGVRGCAGVSIGQPAQSWDIAGQFEDFGVVDVVEHRYRAVVS
jgi:hypothetical protein